MINVQNKRVFYISSGSQLDENTSVFTAAIQMPESGEYDRITLMQCNIPISYYVVQSGNNTFNLIEGINSTLITVPIGNYNANSFSIIVAALLTAASAYGFNYTITFPNSFNQTQTGKFTYGVNSVGIQCGFQLPQNSEIALQMGFNEGSSPMFNIGVSQTLISTNVVKFIPENTVFIHSNLVNDEYNDILQEIYSSNSAPFQNLVFLNPDPLGYSKKLSSRSIQLAQFSITDEFNRPIFLNGLDIVLTVMVYKDPDIYTKVGYFIEWIIGKISNGFNN